MTSVAIDRIPFRQPKRIDVSILAAGDDGLRDHRKVGRDDPTRYMGPESPAVVPVDRGQRWSTADVHCLVRKCHGRTYGVAEGSAPADLAGRGVESAHGLIVASKKDDAVTHGR